ncbi:MAG: pyridoxal phosphate-dependent aminotransferase [Promethearchaeota archaeon]
MNKESHTIKPSRIIQRFLASEYLTPPSYYEHIQNNIIYLDKNENPFTPPLGDLASLNLLSFVKNYPDPSANTFLKLLSEKINVPISFLVAGSGSDELLDLIIRIFSSSRNAVLSVSPSFSMYKFYAKINGAKYLSVPLKLQLNEVMGIAQYDLDQQKFMQMAKSSKIIILARPNNPDGMLLPLDFIKKILELKKLVIIDEAYIDFSNESSLKDLTKSYNNLIILRSFSKSHSLAGLRLGYIITNPSIKKIVTRVKGPYSVNNLALFYGSLLLNTQEEVLANINKIKSIREEFYKDLLKLRGKSKAFYFHPSEANFILLRFQSAEIAKSLYQYFLNNQIKVRNFEAGLPNCLRISIGTGVHMKKVIEIIKLYFEVN